MNIKKILNNKKFKHGSLATVIIIVFIVIVLLINILAKMLVERYPLNFDFTSGKAYTLSEQSIEYAQNVDQKVEVLVMQKEEDFTSQGQYYIQANTVLKQYAQYSDNITVSYHDLTAEPQYAAEFTGVSSASVVVKSDKRYKVLSATDLYEVNTQYASYYGVVDGTIQSSTAEQAMASALMYVTSANIVKGAFITGHNEYHSQLALPSILSSNNYEMTEVELLSEDIDEDVQFIIISGPSSDYTEAEITKLDKFMDNGGKLGKTLFYLADVGLTEYPNLAGFLKDWGIELQKGIALETDSNKIISDTKGAYVYNELVDTEYSQGMQTESVMGMMFQPITMEALFESKNSITVTPIYRTYDTTVFLPLDAGDDWSPSAQDKESFVTALRSAKTGNSTKSEVFAFGSALMFNATFTNESSLNNADYFLNALNTMTDQTDNIQILSKSLSAQTLGISESQVNGLAVLFIVIVPLALLVAGIVIYLRRRNR